MRSAPLILLFLTAIPVSFASDSATPEESEKIKAALAKLGSESFEERTAANVTLQKFGTLARPFLEQTTTADAEVKKSVAGLLRTLPPSRTERDLPDYWNKDMKVEIPRLYDEWESELKRLHSIDGTPCDYIGGFQSNISKIKHEFSIFFSMKPDPVLDAMIELRKTQPEEELKSKDGGTTRLSPARFLASFKAPQEIDPIELESSTRLFDAARSATPPSEADWKALRPFFDTGVGGPKLTMVFSDASLADVLWTILGQSDLRIFSEPPALFGELAKKRISIRMENVSLDSALSSVLDSVQEVEYKLEGRGTNRYLLLRKKAAK